MPLNKPWGEYKELLDVLAEHNVQGLSIANLQKDRTGLEIPRDWEGGLSGGPCTNASTELIRKVYKEYGDRFAIAGIGGVFTPEQAYAKIRSGSSLVMFISSLMYRGPQQITVLKRGLAQLLRRDGFEHVSDASAWTWSELTYCPITHGAVKPSWGGDCPMGRLAKFHIPQNTAVLGYRPMRVLPPHGKVTAP